MRLDFSSTWSCPALVYLVQSHRCGPAGLPFAPSELSEVGLAVSCRAVGVLLTQPPLPRVPLGADEAEPWTDKANIFPALCVRR